MSSSSSTEKADLAWAAVSQFYRSLDKALSDLNDLSLLDASTIAMLDQHGEHIAAHIEEQEDVDPYKIVSWLGCALLRKTTLDHKNLDNRCPSHAVTRAIILTLEGFLYADVGISLEEDDRLLLQRMLIREKIDNYDSDQGIWQNGLYAAFHMASVVGKTAMELKS